MFFKFHLDDSDDHRNPGFNLSPKAAGLLSRQVYAGDSVLQCLLIDNRHVMRSVTGSPLGFLDDTGEVGPFPFGFCTKTDTAAKFNYALDTIGKSCLQVGKPHDRVKQLEEQS